METNIFSVLEESSRVSFKTAMDSIKAATEDCIQFIEDKNAMRTQGVIIFRKKAKIVMSTGKAFFVDQCASECLGQCKNKTQVNK